MLKERSGQVTIFVILALIVVAVVIVIFAFPSANVFSSEVNPSSYLRSCIEPEINIIKDILSDQGGYSTPDNYAMYQDLKLQYLCYTSQYYVPCSVQQPLLLKHMQDEVKKYIEPRAKQCFEDLKDQYESRGYEVSAGQSQISVGIVPGNIIVEFIAPMTLRKEDVQTFDKFAIGVNSEWYDLINIATNIIQYESTFGDSETSLYISYYPDLIIEKTRRDDGSTIYKLSDVTTEERFAFATRSLVWPQGLI
ncbi:hypothetical protein FJZ21_03285 [Candidatus Pacearchaeota archaeon]|nr:hypothetical protein [Candidatus Pacearchaeota archaeon]